MATTIIPARAIIPFLVAMMLLTGVCNTLLTKYQVGLLPPSPSSTPEANTS
jgi:hypothetical protein